jgi:hypothetical protein
MRAWLAALALTMAAGAGCSSLLPNNQEQVMSPWHSFDAARDAIDHIVPDQTTVAELKAAGIDPYTSPNVQLLSFSDILLRFPMIGADYTGGLDPGLHRCLAAGKTCTGYAITIHVTHRDRTGNFWFDMFGFKRVTDVTGWTFNALILLVDGKAVYTLYGGQPKVREQEVTRQPLGPVQGIGEAAAANLVK